MLRSLRNRLIAIVSAVVGIAMGVVFLYVVPSLRDNLVTQRLDRLAKISRQEQRSTVLREWFAAADYANPRYRAARTAIERLARLTNAQVSVFAYNGSVPLAVNIPTRAALPQSDPIVAQAVHSGGIARGAEGGGIIVVAFAMPNGAVAVSQRVSDIDATASLVEQRILVATGLALGIASLVGWLAALAIARRVQRLEGAARRIAAGDFDRPIADDSPDELGRLARAFDLMQLRLEQIDRSRKDFIANASHELRTPLFSLAGFLELLDDEDLDPETRDEFLRTMREQVNRLTKLATDLLDLSRLDSGAVAIEREPLDLTVTARTLVREFRGLASRHGSRVVLGRGGDTPPRGIGDEQRVQQIGRVLVDNAIRHNPPGTEVRVTVDADGDRVSLAVSDDGPGIDGAVRAHLFERFYRGSEATASGSGLGLAIAHELAQRMGGSLVVETADGQTTFRLVLPASADVPPRAAATV